MNYGKNFQSKTVKAVMVLPMFFARGFIVWFLLVALLVFFVIQVLFAKEKPEQVGTDCNRRYSR